MSSWGPNQASQGPRGRTLGTARARGLPGLRYLLSVSRPARHFLTALSRGRGQGPSPVSEACSLAFPASRQAPRGWEAGGGAVGGVGRGRGASPAQLLPGTGTPTVGAAVHPRPWLRGCRHEILTCPVHPFQLSAASHCHLPTELGPCGPPPYPALRCSPADFLGSPVGHSCGAPAPQSVRGGGPSVPSSPALRACQALDESGRPWASQWCGQPGWHVPSASQTHCPGPGLQGLGRGFGGLEVARRLCFVG